MIIRNLRNSDKEVYMKMSAEFYSSAAVIADIPAKFRERAFEEYISGNSARCFIFEEDGICIGYGIICFYFSQECGGTCTIFDELYISENYRSRGYGKQYFEYVFKNFPSARYMLEVEPENERAKRLYEKLGFARQGYVKMIKGL